MLPTTIPNDINKYFFNRNDDIIEVEKYIYTIRQDLPNQILIIGKKGVGKTFFVKKLLHDADDDILTIYIDLSNIYAYYQKITEEAILLELLNLINNTLTGDGRLDRIKGALNSFVQNFLYRQYDIDENIDIFNITLPKFSKNYSKLSRLVMELLQKIVDSSDKINGIIIAFDEIELLKHVNNPEAFFYLFRSSMKNQKNISYILTGNIDDEVLRIIGSYDFSFGSRIPRYYLNPFNLNTTTEYLKKYAPDLKFTDNGFKMFHQCTLGIPSYINNFANSLSENEVYDWNNLIETFFNLSQIENIWLGMWNNLSDSERKVIRILMDNILTFDEISQKSKLDEDCLQEIIYSLNRKHIVGYNVNEENYILIDHMLVLWLKHKKEITGFYPI